MLREVIEKIYNLGYRDWKQACKEQLVKDERLFYHYLEEFIELLNMYIDKRWGVFNRENDELIEISFKLTSLLLDFYFKKEKTKCFISLKKKKWKRNWYRKWNN